MGNTDRPCLRRKRWHVMLVRGVCVCERCGELGAEQCVVETEGTGARLMEYLRCRRVLCLGGGRVESHFHSGLMPNPAAGPDRPSYFNRHLPF